MAVPPPALHRADRLRDRRRSSVGPVIVPSVVLNGTTITRSCGCRCAGERSAAWRTKSIRRDMLWLVSTSSTKVARQRLARDEIELLRHAVLADRERRPDRSPLTNRPVLS